VGTRINKKKEGGKDDDNNKDRNDNYYNVSRKGNRARKYMPPKGY
jgi:hypothetical protein